ncbi:MAG: winged helix DNA-binding protein [Porcipelethomonas sp.]
MQKVLDDVKKNGSVTETEIGELLNVRSTRSYAIVRKMCTFGLLVSQGRGKNKKYYLNM